MTTSSISPGFRDANLARTWGWDDDGRMNWPRAFAWIDHMNTEFAFGFDDWRMPDAHNQDGSGPDNGYAQQDSEIGYMFYTNLGGTAWYYPGPTFTDGNGRSVSFSHLMAHWYWTGTPAEGYSGYAWAFDMGLPWSAGRASRTMIYAEPWVWAVRPGDVPTITPTPSAALLLASGLVGLVAVRKKRKK